MPNKSSVSTTLKNTTRIYYALLLLALLVLLVSSLLSNQIGPVVGNDPQTNYFLKLFLYCFAALAMFVAFYYPSRIVKQLAAEASIDDKLSAYKKASIIRFAIFSFTAIMVSLFFILTADNNILLVKAIILLFMIIYKPSELKIKTDLNINDDEANCP